MFVVAMKRGSRAWFADSEWDHTMHLSAAATFADRGEATKCAAAMRMAFGGKWLVVPRRTAINW